MSGVLPGLVFGGCHGPDEKAVFDELCENVEETIFLYRKDRGNPFRHLLRDETWPTKCKTPHSSAKPANFFKSTPT